MKVCDMQSAALNLLTPNAPAGEPKDFSKDGEHEDFGILVSSASKAPISDTEKTEKDPQAIALTDISAVQPTVQLFKENIEISDANAIADIDPSITDSFQSHDVHANTFDILEFIIGENFRPLPQSLEEKDIAAYGRDKNVDSQLSDIVPLASQGIIFPSDIAKIFTFTSDSPVNSPQQSGGLNTNIINPVTSEVITEGSIAPTSLAFMVPNESTSAIAARAAETVINPPLPTAIEWESANFENNAKSENRVSKPAQTAYKTIADPLIAHSAGNILRNDAHIFASQATHAFSSARDLEMQADESGNFSLSSVNLQETSSLKDFLQTTKPSSANGSFATMAHLSHASVTEQVVLHMKQSAGDGPHKINIQLQPEALGRVEVQINVAADGKANVHVTADNKDTLMLLRSDVRELEKLFTDVGMKTDPGSLSFNLRGEQNPYQDQQKMPKNSHYATANDDKEEDAMILPIPGTRKMVAVSGLDIKV